MNVGKLRHRVQIQSASGDRPSNYTWATVATRWASWEPLSGRELMEAQAVRDRATIRVTMRYYSGITPEYRLRLLASDGATVRATANILSVINEDTRNATMMCLCEEAG